METKDPTRELLEYIFTKGVENGKARIGWVLTEGIEAALTGDYSRYYVTADKMKEVVDYALSVLEAGKEHEINTSV